MPGPTSCPSLRKRSIEWLYQSSPTEDESPPEVATMFMPIWPPYLPRCTQLCGTTYGSSGSRSASFGILPASACALSSGDSWKVAGLGGGVFDEPFPVDGPELAPVPLPLLLLLLPPPHAVRTAA